MGDTGETTVMRKVSQSGTYLIQQDKQTILLATIVNIGMMRTVTKSGFWKIIGFVSPSTYCIAVYAFEAYNHV